MDAAPVSSRRRALRAGVALAVPAGLAGCAWMPPAQTAALVRPPTDPAVGGGAGATRPTLWGPIPVSAHLDAQVPFFPQTAHDCGPATLASLLGAAGIAADPVQLFAQTVLPARGGSLQVEMLAAARRQGALATVLPERLEALLAEVAAGRPVGVLLNLGLSWWTQWHYATLVGFDLPAQDVFLHSGTRRAERWSLATFEHTWTRGGSWAFAVTPPGTLPRSAEVLSVESATLALERLVPPAVALKAWTAVVERWPGRALGRLGAGNAAFALARWAEAARHFEAAAEQHNQAAAWNNLALARAQLGDRAGARRAAETALACATAHEPALLPAVRDTLSSLDR